MIKQAREDTSSSITTCSCCGATYELESFNPKALLSQKMKQENICFTCAFWKDKIEHPLSNREIINGMHYVFNQWLDERRYFKGCGGATAYILTNDRIPKRSNDVWCQGSIPKRFRGQLPDTSVFITQKQYTQICKNPNYLCQAKGCWDRHHCYWFDEKLNTEDEWNVIPSNHQPGEELCEIFISKESIYG